MLDYKYYCQYLLVRQIIMIESEIPKWQFIKDLCLKQNRDFQQWQKEKDYNQFHYSHYDWWAFPIDRRSSYGDKYKLSIDDRFVLIKDEQFIAALRSNAILVCQSWGYDLIRGEDILDRKNGQCWQDWPIRHYKLTNSLEYFDQEDLFLNAIKYGLRLIREGNDFTYGPKNLKQLFFNNEEYLRKREREKLQAHVAQNKCNQKIQVENSLLKSEEMTQKLQQRCVESQKTNIFTSHKNQSE